jgi:ribosomal protein L11 methyltransferase
VSEKLWHAVEAIAARDAREAIEYGLMEAGALGTETKEAGETVSVTAYSESEINPDVIRTALLDALRVYSLSPTSLLDLKIQSVADRDWLAEWKKDWRPVEVGRFIISPPWIESVPSASADGSFTDRIVIRINPGMAFGTGTHETTRLCLRTIEKYFRGGSFLDVGTGTGILAIAAALSFPDARIEACDIDAEAIEIAKDNARLNGCGERIVFRAGSVEDKTASADLVCANLTAPVIVELLPALLGATCGRLILSGILDSQVEMIQTRLSELGADSFEIERDGEWASLAV